MVLKAVLKMVEFMGLRLDVGEKVTRYQRPFQYRRKTITTGGSMSCSEKTGRRIFLRIQPKKNPLMERYNFFMVDKQKKQVYNK